MRVLWPVVISDTWLVFSAVALAITGAFVTTAGEEVHPSAVGRAVALPPLLFIGSKGMGAWVFPLLVAGVLVLLANRMAKAGLIAPASRNSLTRWIRAALILVASSFLAPFLSIPAFIFRMSSAMEDPGPLPLSMLLLGPPLFVAATWMCAELALRAGMGCGLKLTLTGPVLGRVLGGFALWTITTMILSPTLQDPVAYALGLFAAVAQLLLVCSLMLAIDAAESSRSPAHR